MRLAHPPGDELRVLGAEVDDQHRVEVGLHLPKLPAPAAPGPEWPRGRRQLPMPTDWARWSCLPSVCSAGATITSALWNSRTVS